MGDLVEQLVKAVGQDNVLVGGQIHDDYTHDEALTTVPVTPLAVVTPTATADVVSILQVADEGRTPVIARGSGTGLSGASVPRADGIVPHLLPRVVPVQEMVQVEYFLPGCPPPAARIKMLVAQLLAGTEPKLQGTDLKFG